MTDTFFVSPGRRLTFTNPFSSFGGRANFCLLVTHIHLRHVGALACPSVLYFERDFIREPEESPFVASPAIGLIDKLLYLKVV